MDSDSHTARALVSEKSGTTREGKSSTCKLGRLTVELNDTGGLEDDFLAEVSELVQKMRNQMMCKVRDSNIILFVIDAKSGLSPIDSSLARLIRPIIPPHARTIVVANKAESESMFGEYVAECYDLDMGDPVLISAKQNEGIDDLYERIIVELEDAERCLEPRDGAVVDSLVEEGNLEPDNDQDHDIVQDDVFPENTSTETHRPHNLMYERPIQIGIIGRPNAGKSSILNALISEDRAIVDDTPGTTTDSIAVNWDFHNHKLRLVDTAGIGRGWKRQTGAMNDIGMETLRTINKSQICILVLDGAHAFRSNTLKFPSRSEVQLGNEVLDAGKCLVIAVNKWDEIPEKQQSRFRKGIHACVDSSFHSVKNLPIVFVSAKEKANLNTLLVNMISTYRKWNTKVSSSRLNDWLEAFVARNPPPWKDGQKQYPKFINQTRSRPPTFSLYTNTFATFPENYLKQMRELMKEEFGLRGVPIRINLRSTLMPKPGSRIRDRDVARWKRLGPAQAAAVDRIRKSKRRDLDHKDNEID